MGRVVTTVSGVRGTFSRTSTTVTGGTRAGLTVVVRGPDGVVVLGWSATGATGRALRVVLDRVLERTAVAAAAAGVVLTSRLEAAGRAVDGTGRALLLGGRGAVPDTGDRRRRVVRVDGGDLVNLRVTAVCPHRSLLHDPTIVADGEPDRVVRCDTTRALDLEDALAGLGRERRAEDGVVDVRSNEDPPTGVGQRVLDVLLGPPCLLETVDDAFPCRLSEIVVRREELDELLSGLDRLLREGLRSTLMRALRDRAGADVELPLLEAAVDPVDGLGEILQLLVGQVQLFGGGLADVVNELTFTGDLLGLVLDRCGDAAYGSLVALGVNDEVRDNDARNNNQRKQDHENLVLLDGLLELLTSTGNRRHGSGVMTGHEVSPSWEKCRDTCR